MDPTAIAASIPLFFLLIGGELLLNRRKGYLGHRFQDSITDLSCGVGSLIHGAFTKLAALLGYAFVYEQLAVLSIDGSSGWAWVAAIVGVDLGYYWWHRASHRVNVLWAGHVVHHQSEEYNLAVALRQSWYASLFEWIFYLPLAVLGFPPIMYLTAKTFNTLYQFWIHTEAVGRLGPLEWVFNTPSHHRVHHAINPVYIDRNYAGILIIWDRLFGTFAPEGEQPVYGTVKPLSSWNPLWANVANWVELVRMSQRTQRWRDKWRVWWAPPEWKPDDLGGPVTIPEVTRAQQRKYATRSSRSLDWYVGIQFALVSGATTIFLLLQDSLPWSQLGAFGAVLLAAVTSWGGLFEGRRWAWPLEAARQLAAVAVTAWLAAGTPFETLAMSVSAVVSCLSLLWLLRLRPALQPTAAEATT